MKKLNTKKWMQIVLALLLFVGFVSNAFKGGDNVTGALIGAVLCLVWAIVVYCKPIKGPQTTQNESTVYVTKNGNTYHSIWTCQHLSGKKSFAIKRSEAQQQNYKPCKKCHPYQ